jgi:uncharacterized protein YutE (UPF0331/DUF86 family)
MVDPGRLAALLDRIDGEVVQLRQLAEMPADELSAHPLALPAAKYRLVVAVEAAIDAGEHIIASEGLRASTDYADVFTVLGQAGYLDEQVTNAMGQAARFRNLLVHGYATVDDRRVVEILKTRLGDLAAFTSAIAAKVLDDTTEA